MSSTPSEVNWKCVMCGEVVHQQAIVRTFNRSLGVCITCDEKRDEGEGGDDERK